MIEELLLLIFTVLGAYFDLKRDRDIPTPIPISFLALSLVLTILSGRPLAFPIIVGGLSTLGFLLGAFGSAEIFYFTSYASLLSPSEFFSVLFYGVLTFLFYVLWSLRNVLKMNIFVLMAIMLSIAILIVFAPIISITPLPLFIAVLFPMIVLLETNKQKWEAMFSQEVSIEKAVEEVIDEKKHPELKGKIKKVLLPTDIEKLKSLGYKTIWIKKGLPFLPFLLLGLLLNSIYPLL